MIRRRIEVLERVHLREHRRADFTGLDDRLDPHHRWIEAPVVGDAELDAVRATRREHAVAFRRRHRQRFFAEHVFAGFSCGDGLLRVQVDGVAT